MGVVTTMAVAVAYLRQPRWKALILIFPIPFTLATLAVGRPVDASNAMGLIALLIFTHSVRFLHQRWQFPIIVAIAASTALYLLLAWSMEQAIPKNEVFFWLACAMVLAVALSTHYIFGHRHEPPHRSPLPVYLKASLVALVVVGLVLVKKSLGGFVTTFPMVGLIAAYETRKSLGTTCRAIPVTMFLVTPMLVVIRLMQPTWGLGLSLLAAWGVFGMLAPLVVRATIVRPMDADA